MRRSLDPRTLALAVLAATAEHPDRFAATVLIAAGLVNPPPAGSPNRLAYPCGDLARPGHHTLPRNHDRKQEDR